MAIKHLLRGLLLVALINANPSAAQGTGPALPDPGRLSTDWWTYFVIDPKTDADSLAQRIEKVRQYLVRTKEAVPAGSREALNPIFESLIQRFDAYQNLKGAPLPIAPPAKVPAQIYSMEKIFESMNALRKLRLELDVEAQDIKRLERALKSAEMEQSRRKVAYLELPDAAPDRIEQGLQLMHKRVQLEIAVEQLRRRRVQQEVLTTQIKSVQKELAIAFDRISVDPARIAYWEEQRQAAILRLSDLNNQLTRTQIDESSAVTNTPIQKAQAQLTTQKVTRLEIEAAIQQVLAAKAEWAIAGIRRLAVDNQEDTKTDRELLKKHLGKLDDIKERFMDWRRTTAQSRRTATEQLAEEKDAALVTMYESRLVIADETERYLRQLEDELDTATRLSELIKHLLVKREGHLGQGRQLAEDAAKQTWEVIQRVLTTSLFEIGETPVTSLGLIRFIIIVFVAWWVSKLLRRGLNRVSQRRETVSQSSVYALGQVLHYFILAIAVIMGLSSIGVDFTKFALVASALGIGIGFGLQNLVSNFVAGLIILFEKSLKAGDFVELESGVSGEVKEINMRSTLITTNDNIDILVPNSEFVNGRVTNWTMREVYRRVHIPFGVAYGTDKKLVRQAALEAAEAVPWTLKGNTARMPQVWFVEFGDSSLNFELIVWLIPEAVKRPSAVHAAYLWEIESKLQQYDIEVPFPQRDLHLRSVFGKRDEAAWPVTSGESEKAPLAP